VLGEIYWEISFHGRPTSRDGGGAELRQALRDVEDGRAKLVPWKPPENPVN
jgi:hypothetical protein